MPAAADAHQLTPRHPLGAAGAAEPPAALRQGVPPTTPSAHQGSVAAPVIQARVAPAPYAGSGAPDQVHAALAGAAPRPGAPLTPFGSPSGPVEPLAVSGLASRAHARADVLYRAGERADAALIVEAGLVALELDVPRPRVVALAGPGDVIGALSPGHGAYLETATALSGEVVVRHLDEWSQAELPPDVLSELLLSAAAARVAVLTHALEEAEQPVPARVARAFLRLGSRFGQPLADGTVRLTLPLTHDTLAAMVGAARETTTAVIAEFRQLGMLDGTRGNYRMRPAALAEYALKAALAE